MKHLITVLILLAASASSTLAFAQSSAKLIRNIPTESQIVVGVEVPKVKKSFLFDEVLNVLKDESSASSILGFVLRSDAFDLDKDIRSMVIAMEKAPTNPQNPKQPASLVVIDGDLDREKVKKAATATFGDLETKKHGKLQVWTRSGLSMAFVDDSTLVLADDGDFARQAWKAIANEKASGAGNNELTQLMALTDLTRGVWMTVVTTDVPAAPGAVPMDGAAMSLDVRKGVAADFRTKFEKGEDAEKALQQFMDLKNESGQDPLVTMLGAKPILDNLTAKVVDERVLAMDTSMTNAQVKQMMVRIKAMSQQQPPMAPSGAKTPTSPTPQTPTAPPPTGEGANADFN